MRVGLAGSLAIFIAVHAQGASAPSHSPEAGTIEGDTVEEVYFIGDEEISVERGSQTVELIDRDALIELPPLPEYDVSLWLLLLPAACLILLAVNVQWRPVPRRRARRRVKGRSGSAPNPKRERRVTGSHNIGSHGVAGATEAVTNGSNRPLNPARAPQSGGPE